LPAAAATKTAPATGEKTYIQLGAFAQPENAKNRRREFAAAFARIPHKIHFRDGLHLLLAGPYSGETAARGDDETLCAAGWCGFLTRAP
ncbi:MAG: SPOR domain-containing protein, partial [Betaproteobacteria bacterium]|nr:SPOR domain-containing protein [Betaproteobacteria bacterium]